MGYIGKLLLLSLFGQILGIDAVAVKSAKRQSANTLLLGDILNSTENPFLDITDPSIIEEINTMAESEQGLIFNISRSSPGRDLTTIATENAASNRIMIGPFQVFRCTIEQQGQLAGILEFFKHYALNAAYEANKGTRSRFGYTSFFKTDDSASEVANVFTQMANGTPSTSIFQGATPGATNPVQINCLNENDPGVANFYQTLTRNPETLGAFVTGSTMILLTPTFFQAPIRPNHQTNCPTIVNNNPSPNSAQLQYSQTAALAHEMSHIYMFSDPMADEVYKISDAIALDEDEALSSPSNYGFFYAAVAAKCLAWPTPPDELRL